MHPGDSANICNRADIPEHAQDTPQDPTNRDSGFGSGGRGPNTPVFGLAGPKIEDPWR